MATVFAAHARFESAVVVVVGGVVVVVVVVVVIAEVVVTMPSTPSDVNINVTPITHSFLIRTGYGGISLRVRRYAEVSK